MKLKLILFTILMLTTIVNENSAQSGFAHPNDTWVPRPLMYSSLEWTDWSNAGLEEDIPSLFNYIDFVPGTATQNSGLINDLIETAHMQYLAFGQPVAIKLPAQLMMFYSPIILESGVYLVGTSPNESTYSTIGYHPSTSNLDFIQMKGELLKDGTNIGKYI